jgi:hypothetical protein
MKRSKPLMAMLACLFCWQVSTAQYDSTANPWKWQAYAEGYFSYDFQNPSDNARPWFLYNFDIHQQPQFNLAFAKVGYSAQRWRGNLALATGTYIYANYAAEPDWAKPLFEANAGYKLSAKHDIWLDAGVMPSHIGFESAVGKDNATLTRSLSAENTPYFETGIKLSYTSPNQQWYFSGLLLNGWQRIKPPPDYNTLAFGSQVTFKPNDNFTINSSSFIGSDKPDSARRIRYFHDLYAIMQLSPAWTLTAGLDVGWEQAEKGSSDMNTWLNPTLIVRCQAWEKIAFAARAEYYNDQNGVIIATKTANGFQTFGWSCNADWQLGKHLLWRVEYRQFNSKDAIFPNDNGFVSGNKAITTSFAAWF